MKHRDFTNEVIPTTNLWQGMIPKGIVSNWASSSWATKLTFNGLDTWNPNGQLTNARVGTQQRSAWVSACPQFHEPKHACMYSGRPYAARRKGQAFHAPQRALSEPRNVCVRSTAHDLSLVFTTLGTAVLGLRKTKRPGVTGSVSGERANRSSSRNATWRSEAQTVASNR